MSDDEAARRRAPGLAIIGLVVLVAVAWWLRGRIVDRGHAFFAFCNATHAGETWEHVQARASSQGWPWVKQGPAEWLIEFDEWTYRAGCTVTLDANGRVLRTRTAGALPGK